MALYYEDIVVGGRVIGQRLVNTDPAEPLKRIYSLSEWLDAMTDAEQDVILDYVHGATGTANQQRAARRVWEYWRATNRVDMNVQKNQQVLQWLVTNSGGVWTAARRLELIG